MSTWITMNEIINMIDEKYDYAQDYEIVELLAKSSIPTSYRHLVGNNKQVIRYFMYFAEANGIDPDNYYAIINVDGSTKSTKYDLDDVTKVLNSHDIDRRINELLLKKTFPGPFGRVPRCIYHEYIESITGEEKQSILNLTGYTAEQIELFSVPDEILTDTFKENDIEITKLQEKLDELKLKQKDLVDELTARGYSV